MRPLSGAALKSCCFGWYTHFIGAISCRYPMANGNVAVAPVRQRFFLTVIVPAYNEQEVLPEFHRRVTAVLETIEADAEILYVNDGSSDTTREVMSALAASDSRVAILELTRNFGKEIALTAVLADARGYDVGF